MAGVAGSGETGLPRICGLVVREYMRFGHNQTKAPHAVYLGSGGVDTNVPLSQSVVRPVTVGIPDNIGEFESINLILGKGYVQRGEPRESMQTIARPDNSCFTTRITIYSFEQPARPAKRAAPTGVGDTFGTPQ